MASDLNLMDSVFIAGHWRQGRGDLFRSVDPATGETVWEGREADADQVAEAVAAAEAAFDSWALVPLDQRVQILNAYRNEVEKHQAELAETISREMGKALWESTAEVGAMKGKIALSVASQQERAGQKVDETVFGRAELAHRPHGVMAVFGPYNFPGHLPNGHIVPALLAGNTVVFKPSEFAPATARILVQCLQNAGVPPGVVNLVSGGREPGGALLECPIAGVLFTGSARAGTYIHGKFAGRPEVILALEMGGNNPLIVWDCDNLDAAADIAAQSAFLTTGQRCSCARRLIVPDGETGEDLVGRIVYRASRVKIGAWTEDDVFMGPLVHDAAARGALAFQSTLQDLGGRVIKPLEQLDRGDAFVCPGVIDMTDVDRDHDEELFGPFLQVWRVSSFDTALQCANATRFGLAGGLISDDASRWERARVRMRAGILNWNRPTAGASSAMPFGGPGLSGNHRPSAWYAADYCAWPQASQVADQPKRLPAIGFPD